MSGMRSLNGASNFQPRFSGKHSRSSILEIDSWMLNKIQAISPLVDHLMMLIEGSQCVSGKEFDIELALREALRNAAVHGNQEDSTRKVHIRCRCWPGKEISIVVTDQGKGFDFERAPGSDLALQLAAGHGRGIRLMKAYMDDVHFARGYAQAFVNHVSFVKATVGEKLEIEAANPLVEEATPPLSETIRVM